MESEGQEAADNYFIEGKFDSQCEARGYAIGIIESIGQSDHCPPQLYDSNYSIIVTILDNEKQNEETTLYAIHQDGKLYIPEKMNMYGVSKKNSKKVSKLYHSQKNAIIAA